MADIQVNEASNGVGKDRFSPQFHLCSEEGAGELAATEASGGPEEVTADESTEAAQEIGTACYLCYGQCVNFGVQGITGRPCAKGFAEIIDRRRRVRMGVRTGCLSEP